ncbi:tat (twin-arginine translocation) pathway signal sequence [Acidibrevibacterium fodinaquatile]|uniref:tat (twin-arginine translocation) pathway signal sequence n=1 Tax=Acidibrevibacterium fodinaquatile TaxID=1969806 RepID=UPI000E0DC65D|nr:tat (twin-arginine translocation) pathway signal sequence [Acidibrevibacterium fodinaquatile]
MPRKTDSSHEPIPLTRRGMLQGSSLLIGVLSAGSALAPFVPSRTWALELSALDDRQARIVMAFIKHLYPHPSLDDAVYALVVKAVDQKAAADKATRLIVLAGIDHLNAIGNGDWLGRDVALQEIDVRALEGTPFFSYLRVTSVNTLYNNPLAFKHFGYGGEAGDTGYLYTGFNDLKWLPDPPPSASGPIPKDD